MVGLWLGLAAMAGCGGVFVIAWCEHVLQSAEQHPMPEVLGDAPPDAAGYDVGRLTDLTTELDTGTRTYARWVEPLSSYLDDDDRFRRNQDV